MLLELRFGLRLVRRHLIPVGVTVAGLALAIGVAASVFSLVNAAVLRPYGMPDPSSVVSVARSDQGGFAYWRYSTFVAMRRGTSLADVEASTIRSVRIAAAAHADNEISRWTYFVSGGYLQTYGARPALGRTLQPGDDAAGAAPVVAISHHLWKAQFGSALEIVGDTVWLNGVPATVIGVMAPEFTGPEAPPPAVWVPLALHDDLMGGPAFNADAADFREVHVTARLKPGASMTALRDNLDAVLARAAVAADPHAAAAARPRLEIYSAASPISGADAADLYLGIAALFGIVGLVLTVACANAANLLRAAAATRVREIGIRLALGATRRRLIRQLVGESVLLGLVAASGGYLLSIWLAPVMAAIVDLPPELDLSPDVRVLAFSIGLAVACGLGTGLTPARSGARGDVLSALQSGRLSGDQRGARSRLRASFIGLQAAISMLLLVIASLLARSALALNRTDIGYDAERLLAVSFSMPRANFDEPAFTDAAVAAVRSLAAIERASITQTVPFGGSTSRARFTHEGRTFTVYRHDTDADYFAAAGIPITRGRGFTASEVAREARVALISDNAARAFFGGMDPIGRTIAGTPFGRDGDAEAIIIGVTGDTVTSSLGTERYGSFYQPIRRQRDNPPSVLVRASNPPRAARAVEQALRGLDPRVTVRTSLTSERVDGYFAAKRMMAWLAVPMALLALLLAIFGVYGVTSFVVSQRTQEVSVRMAIGASAGDVMRLLLRESLRPVAIGLVVGLAGALILGRVLSSELSGISAHDPMAITVSTLLLGASAALAVMIPARRAARTNPAGVLREV